MGTGQHRSRPALSLSLSLSLTHTYTHTSKQARKHHPLSPCIPPYQLVSSPLSLPSHQPPPPPFLSISRPVLMLFPPLPLSSPNSLPHIFPQHFDCNPSHQHSFHHLPLPLRRHPSWGHPPRKSVTSTSIFTTFTTVINMEMTATNDARSDEKTFRMFRSRFFECHGAAEDWLNEKKQEKG